MRKTKYLFDDTKTPEGMVSVSQIQTYLSCKKKWEYGYIENLTPRVDRKYMTIGKLCHKGMQTAMQKLWEIQKGISAWKIVDDKIGILIDLGIGAMRDEMNYYMDETPFLDEEVPDIMQMYDDACSVFTQALKEFDPTKYEVVEIKKDTKVIPALELHFMVPCAGSKGLHGYIDAILKDKDTGYTWCVDYKFRKTLSPDEDESFNIQNAVYAYACKKMGVKISGTMTWQHLNTPAADPQILKDGKISRAKIKTTWEHYETFCKSHGQDPEDYFIEMSEKLGNIEWYRVTYEYRNDETINRIWKECVVPVSKSIQRSRNPKTNNYRSLYPWNCKMCQYQSICEAELRDYDVDAIKDREYVLRRHIRK